MDTQKLITFGLVGLAAIYLGRRWVLSLMAFRNNKGGCDEGCGKCGMAQIAEAKGKPLNIIPLKPK